MGDRRTGPHTLVLGLGNDILSDDGVGLRTVRRVEELAGGEGTFAEACVATIDLLPLMSGYDRVIVIDAFISSHHPPGTTVRAAPEDLPHGFGYRSFHTLPFRAALEMGEELGMPMPKQVVIHGMAVEETTTFGVDLSPPVAEAWESWAEEIAKCEFGFEQAGTAPFTGRR